jgi:hypothetical protein
MQQVGQYKTNLTEKYTLALQELETQKASALREAKTSFDESIRQINAMRGQTQSEKATQSLNLLQDLRNKVFAVNQQTLLFAQQLASQNTINNKTVDDYITRMNSTLGSTQILGANLNTNMQNTANKTGLGMSAPQTTTASPYQAGQMQSRMGYHWDETTGQMVPD